MIDKNVIKKVMIDKGLKGVDVAARMGMSPQRFCNFIVKKNYTQEDLARIADALGVVYVSEFRSPSEETGRN